MIDLMRFCANDTDLREHMRAPWLHDGWVYATNGHVCVRVHPGHAEPCEPATDKHPKAYRLFSQWMADDLGAFSDLPKLPARVKCCACKGAERFHVIKCPDCDGGEFTHGRHAYECQECAGEFVQPGWLTTGAAMATKTMACNQCFGRGDEMAAVDVGAVVAEAIYLRWLAALPGIKVRPHGAMDAIAFTFDGGQALLMPRRE